MTWLPRMHMQNTLMSVLEGVREEYIEEERRKKKGIE